MGLTEGAKTVKRAKKLLLLLLTACLTAGAFALPPDVQAAAGELVTGRKTGWEIQYKVLKEGMASGQERTVQVAKVVQNLSSDPDTGHTITIPGDAYIYDGWEAARVFAVASIGAGAFAGCAGIENVSVVKIEGPVALEAGALDGIPLQTVFQVGSLSAKRALLEYGIAEERITYTGIKSKYVAFGDSIAAGYRLPGYTDDAQAVPPGCFTDELYRYLQGNAAYTEAVFENFAVSGSTSTQLLEQIERGDYDHALKDADIITLTIGSNDLLGPFIEIVKQEISDSGIADILDKDRITIRDIKNVLNQIPTIIDRLNEDLKYDEDRQVNAQLLKACEDFKNTQQEILAKLEVLAPDAKVYWTTLYNPFYGQTLDLTELFPAIAGSIPGLNPLPLGELAAPYIEKMNKAFELPDERYEKVDLYETFNNTGLTNVNISGNAADETLVIDLDPHPNAAGHAKIAQIMTDAASGSFHPSDPPADQSGARSILAFSLDGTDGVIDEAGGSITVALPCGTDVSDLAAVFTASDKAEVYVEDVRQQSGVTKNNFTKGTVYTVKSEIGTYRKYTVHVTVKNTLQEEPSGPAAPGSTGGRTKAASPLNSAADTGDDVPVSWYILAALGAAVVMLLCFRKKSQKKRKERT